ncbi:MAG TPA: cation acetate symporter [Solirubrobacteraceae bacterium]|nr:cation acetate symporter [Solirubrobacteraceae bacterium]
MSLALLAIAGVAAGAIGIGAWGVRFARTTSDLLVASRAVTPWWNAAAIGGEYLSAASFLGIAGLQMKYGSAALWLPVGFAGGYLALLFFVAAPLRRFGSYTVADFAEARLGSPRLRSLASAVVLLIGALYLVPQLKGAGLTVREVTGGPYWLGLAAVALVVALNVALGGMRGITYVQAYQYWLKTFAIALPACLLVLHLGGLPERAALFGHELPRAPAGGLVVELEEPQRVTWPDTGRVETLPAGRTVIPEGRTVPVAEGIEPMRGDEWADPIGGDGRASPLFVYSLLLATFLGTMGLPHILVRFYTNRDGPAARRTTVRVLGLLGLFYLFPALYGLLGRALVPELYVTGETDLAVLRIPAAAWPGPVGDALGALVAAGAFAAFMSTASGLLVSVAGTLSYDVWDRVRPPRDRVRDRLRRFRLCAVLAMVVPVALALGTREVDISVLVGWAFALAASTFCPLLLLGIWWTRLTARGAACGLVVGASVTTVAVAVALVTGDLANADTLLVQPALVSVPLAFLAMVLVSLRGPAQPAPEALMRALHAPEGLGLEPASRA